MPMDAWRRVRGELLSRGLLDRESLSRALRATRHLRVGVLDVLVADGLIRDEVLAEVLATAAGRPFLDDGPLPALQDAAGLPRELAARHLIAPLAVEGGTIHVAVANPFDSEALDAVEAALGLSPVVQVATPRRIREALFHLYRQADQVDIVTNLDSSISASRVLAPWQKLVAPLVGIAVVAALAFSLKDTVTALAAMAIVFYSASALYRLSLIVRSLAGRRQLVISDEETERLSGTDLPSYTLMVPLYHEGSILPQLMSSIARLDYPKSKMEVLLLLEEDDDDTRRVAARVALPPYVHVLLVPPDGPRGKPKALNYGLLYARGSYCVIYDAEDVPEPDQLKKAVVAFRRSEGRTACVQSRLDFYNGSQNWLTNLFALDYSMWFDLMLPGLFSTGAPVPLGGTSNHFKVSALREVGGWDAYNVTEDADLGIRLYRSRRTTVVMESVTWEEANSHLWNWVRQRTHWTKGYMLTYLVHMRRPFLLWRELGTTGFISIQVMILGTIVAQILNPVFWGLLLAWHATHSHALESTFTGPLLYAGSILLFGVNFAFLYFNAIAALRTHQFQAVRYAVFLPIYWALASFATYRAIVQLATSPHRWEKTQHGLFEPAAPEPVGGARRPLREWWQPLGAGAPEMPVAALSLRDEEGE
jgi:cellulose synthase/poly-beta-1,6-N-acetylglucosamine synthase-like glycosyltransferase